MKYDYDTSWVGRLAPPKPAPKAYTFAGSHGWVTVELVDGRHVVSGSVDGRPFSQPYDDEYLARLVAKAAAWNGRLPGERGR